MFNKIFVVLLASLSILSGCNECTAPETPTLSSNSPITAGETLTLFAEPRGYNYYQWNGPNGFTSTDPEPVIQLASTSDAGEYTCYAVGEECNSEIATINVAVDMPPAPCTPANNTSDYPPGFPDVIYNHVYEGHETQDGFFTIEASGNNGQLDITFSTPDKPVPGVYRIRPIDVYTPDLEPSDVRITIIAGNPPITCFFYARGGDLYVTKTAGKLTATFCNINFGSAASCNPINSSSARVTVD